MPALVQLVNHLNQYRMRIILVRACRSLTKVCEWILPDGSWCRTLRLVIRRPGFNAELGLRED